MSKITLEQMPRLPTGKRMIHRVTPIYENSYVGKSLYEALGKEFDGVKEIFHTLRKQRFPETVTWGIRYLESKYSIEPDENLSLEERRARLKRKVMKRRPLNPGILENYIKEAWNIICDIDEKYEPGMIKLEIFDDPQNNHRKLIKDMRRVKPAHLVLAILFDVFFGDDDECDYLDLKDEGLSLETEQHFEDDASYKGKHDLIPCDGTVQLGGMTYLDGAFNLDGLQLLDGYEEGNKQLGSIRYRI